MIVLEKFERKTIEIQEPEGIRLHPVWCYRELFVIECRLDDEQAWKIGCIPLGAIFPVGVLGVFDHLEDACEAAIVLADTKQDWATLRRFTDEHHKVMRELARKYRTTTRLMRYAPLPDRDIRPINDAANYS